MDIFAGKWKLNILWLIYKNDGIGFNQLKRKAAGITNIMLVRSLETLATEKLISKKVFGSQAPVRSEYHLTDKAKGLIPIMKELNEWGKNNLI
ncbi:hypothetical protein IV52_GL000963 [Fructilactobacillus lindneri DSM 20690 = JCM 11027]|uniref:HTH hxlR-type domain-containing protein n=2 Tax=Fructilactobacillus lindneri TaxID=53444 RepID=A0A0R2JNC7_9LACO|nr:hypothetical protein IV52_GL000963 [Fructilactobacillus lindneri DSM 20690 = JCM 11027]